MEGNILAAVQTLLLPSDQGKEPREGCNCGTWNLKERK
jgi:hypothetical protein